MAMHLPALDHAFRALADPTRRSIVRRLAGGEATAGEIGAPFPISQPAVSKHLAVLERAGLVERRRSGRTHRFRLREEPMDAARLWLDDTRRFWLASLDRLDVVLRDVGDPPRPDPAAEPHPPTNPEEPAP